MIRIKDGFSGQRATIIPPAYIAEMEENPLSALLHITDIGYYPNALNHYRKRSEPISQYIFIYIVSGKGWYEVGGQHFDVSAGSYFILPPDIPHLYGADESSPWTICWIHFKGTLAAEYISPGYSPVVLGKDKESVVDSHLALFEEMMNVLDSGYSKENLLYVCSIFHHFLGALSFAKTRRRDTEENANRKDDSTSLGIRYMSANIGKKLQLSDIAAHLGCSQSHLSAQFTRSTGLSPIAYFQQMKIKRACELLDFTTLKINQICHMIGIEDPYYFSRLFSHIMGMSPRSYRNIKKG